MKRNTCLRFAQGYAIAVVAVFGIATAVLAETADQQQLLRPRVGQVVNTDWTAIQTFTPSVSGDLTRAEIWLHLFENGGTFGDLRLDIVTTSGGLPTTSSIGQTTLSAGSVVDNAFNGFVFGVPVVLEAGQLYGLQLSSPSTVTNFYAIGGALDGDTGGQDPYASGELWRTFQGGAPTLWGDVFGGNPAGDAAFRTFTALDQQQLLHPRVGQVVNTDWTAIQTFTPSVSGDLTRAEIWLHLFENGGTFGDLRLDIVTTSGGLPTTSSIGQTTLSAGSVVDNAFNGFVFGVPVVLEAGQLYGLQLSSPSTVTNLYAIGM